MPNVGATIRRLREERGLDQAGLADRAGVSQQAISKIERGASAEPKSLPRLCKVLGVTVEQVLTEAGDDGSQRARQKPGRSGPLERRAPRSRWPFMLPYTRFERLTHAQKLHIESVLLREIARLETAGTAERASATIAPRRGH